MVRAPRRALLAAALLVGAAAAPAALGAAGDLDRGFDEDGRAVVHVLGCNETPSLVARQADRDVVLATDTCGSGDGHDTMVALLSPDGVVKGSPTKVDFGGDDTVFDVDVLPDDSIVVTGVTNPLDDDTGQTGDVTVAKLTPAAELDVTFGTGGKVVDDFVVYEAGLSLLPQPDGKLLVVAGRYDPADDDEDLLLLRYTSAGAPDPTYGEGGAVTHEAGRPGAAAQDAAGRVLVAGWVDTQPHALVVQRFTPTGDFDPTFGTGGTAGVAHGDGAYGVSVLVASDGTVLVGGYSYSADDAATLVYRFTADGDPIGAVLDLPIDPHTNRASALTVLEQADGKLLAVGGGHVARFSVDGTPDRFFGENGVSRLSTGDGYSHYATAALDGADHLLVGITVWDHMGAVDGLDDAGVLRMKLTTPHPIRFVPRPANRLYDSRRAPEGALRPLEIRAVQLSGGIVPAEGVSAVVVTVTVVSPTASGYVTVYPAEDFRPLASTVNFSRGTTTANHATVKIRPTQDLGDVWVFNSAGSTHVLLDVAGYYTDGSAPADHGAVPTVGGRFVPLPPRRILDSRAGRLAGDGSENPLGGNRQLSVKVLGRGGVPASGVSAVVMNVTAVSPTSTGYLTVWSNELVRSTTSNLNFTPGRTVPNLVTVPVGPDGLVNIYNSNGVTHLLADVAGYYTTPAVPGTAGEFWSLTPRRVHDTRSTSPVGPLASREIQVLGAGRVPASGVAAVVLNVTVTGPTAGGFLTVHPGGTARPTVSNLNFAAGQTVANQVIVKVGANGKVAFFNSSGRTHVVVDVAGWITS